MLNKTQTPNYDISEIDELFFKLYGFYPTKEGQSYELIVGSILKILNPQNKIMWDERVKGEFDNNTYQIDVSIYGMNIETVMVEAKDHIKYDSKVSRPELDKLAGSLIEVDFKTGYFFSATDYTRDARKKALGSQLNTNAKSITIYHLRPSIDDDREKRLETIKLTISFIDFDYKKIKIGPKLDENDVAYLFPELVDKLNLKSVIEFKYENHQINCHGEFFNEDDINIGWFSFSKILEEDLNSLAENPNNRIQGEWEVEDGQIEIQKRNKKLEKIMYDISFINISVNDEIKSVGQPVLLVKTDDDKLNKLITDNQLKGITFSDKEILFNGATA